MSAHKVRRAALLAAAISAFVAALSATSAAVEGVADAGVLVDLPGGSVKAVSPTGFAWRDGIRVGQRVVRLDGADSSTGWLLETEIGASRVVSRGAPIDAALRESRPIALLGVALAALGLLCLRTRRSWALPAAALALQAAAVPLWIHGNSALSTWSLAAAALVPGFWLSWRVPANNALKVTLTIACLATLGFWIQARFAALPAYEVADGVRSLLAIGGTIAIALDHGLTQRLMAGRTRPQQLTAGDAATLALLAGSALVLIFFFSMPPVFAGAIAAGGVLLVLPRARGFLRRKVESTILSDLRQEARAEAVEAERARLARELHDVPLQQLVGVTRRLELLDGTENEVKDLQRIVEQIREVAVELRPPVLDDLGLAAGLEFLADETRSPAVPVIVDVVNEAGVERGERPPEAVELAAYRIAQEAVLNSIHHGHPSVIRISGHVDRGKVDLRIQDDGVGLTTTQLRSAAARGRMGVASMRRRAQGIDAQLSVGGTTAGTEVRLEWPA